MITEEYRIRGCMYGENLTFQSNVSIYSSETSTSPRTMVLSTQKTVLFPVTAMRPTSPTWWGLNSVTYHCLAEWAVFVFEENAESSAEQDCAATSLRTCGSNLGRYTNYPSIFHGFRQFILANMVVVPRFYHGHFLLKLFQLVMHHSFCHSTLHEYSLRCWTDSAVKCTTKTKVKLSLCELKWNWDYGS